MRQGLFEGCVAGMLVLMLASSTLANRAPIPEPEPEPAVSAVYALKVTETKAAESQILLPKKLLRAGGVGAKPEGSTGFWLDPAVVRTIVAGLMLSAAVVVSLLLLRSRQTKLATASLLVGAISLGVMSTSIADISVGPPPQAVAPEVTVKFVDGDTVTIIMGTDFPGTGR